ncbi:PEP-CTERM-box response regulator transcription f actor [Desulfonema ishimotonii]|uniref:PEP-CTERM-box response regulator transcription f actor n=1 Tax=Desulfonema ishimotonii TaxID=45657 RepID=A0A401FYN2_9BACT|nr:PEP-CTERM-box response regulator transcription factor [Desulfonema ishimotonii]GBC62060.1 PEP-CTERM-box response regulator transcription f actor [Desulfonema ishimotonii]
MKHKLLIVEDENSLAKQMKWGLSQTYEVIIANTVEQARQLLETGAFPVAVLDLGLPPAPDSPREGFGILASVPTISPHTKVIVVTGNAEQENAMKAIDLGAADFCAKPIDLEMLRVILKRTFKIHELEAANRKLRQACETGSAMCGMLGISPAMTRLSEVIRQVSPTDYPVLIRGESGTGKEMAARAIHLLSHREREPMIPINCGAIPGNLLESELFGHEKGAFTGAHQRKIGRLEQARKGTVLLDEIGDMPPELQIRLLRFLQEGTIERVGGTEILRPDVRIIAATHVNLEAAIEAGRFREDLFYRLNVVPVMIPPLRERQADILLIANHFIREEAQKLKRGQVRLSPAAATALTAHSWPGNIRELQNCIYRAMAISSAGVIRPADLGLPDVAEPSEMPRQLPTIKEARKAAEHQAILQALATTRHNISQAAKLLGISRPTLHDLLKKHGIKR